MSSIARMSRRKRDRVRERVGGREGTRRYITLLLLGKDSNYANSRSFFATRGFLSFVPLPRADFSAKFRGWFFIVRRLFADERRYMYTSAIVCACMHFALRYARRACFRSFARPLIRSLPRVWKIRLFIRRPWRGWDGTGFTGEAGKTRYSYSAY